MYVSMYFYMCLAHHPSLRQNPLKSVNLLKKSHSMAARSKSPAPSRELSKLVFDGPGPKTEWLKGQPAATGLLRASGYIGTFLGAKDDTSVQPLMLVHFNIVMYALGYWVIQPVLPFLSEQLGADAFVFGWLQTVISLLQVWKLSGMCVYCRQKADMHAPHNP